MKKAISLGIVLLSTLVLGACSNNSSKKFTNSSKSKSVASTAPKSSTAHKLSSNEGDESSDFQKSSQSKDNESQSSDSSYEISSQSAPSVSNSTNSASSSRSNSLDSNVMVMTPKIQQFFRDYQEYATGGRIDSIRASKMLVNASQEAVNSLISPEDQNRDDLTSINGTFKLLGDPNVVQDPKATNYYHVEVDYTVTVVNEITTHVDEYLVKIDNEKITEVHKN